MAKQSSQFASHSSFYYAVYPVLVLWIGQPAHRFDYLFPDTHDLFLSHSAFSAQNASCQLAESNAILVSDSLPATNTIDERRHVSKLAKHR